MSALARFADFKSDISRGQRSAKTGCEQMQQHRVQTYSITSSARASNAGGRVRANVFAVFRLIRSSNLVA